MSDLISRGAVLTFSRLSNFAIQTLSPILLVRILDVTSYGQYQEFMIYAMLLSVLSEFAVDSSLTYFLPRFPERERAFVSQTTLITLVASALCVSILYTVKPLLLDLATYDFVAPLSAYVFFFVNLNWVEYYWIAKRRPGLVLYYSLLRLMLRISVLLTVAYLTHDVLTIVWSLAAFEAMRTVLVFTYFARLGVFVRDIRRSELVEQLRFAAPVGASAFVQQAGRNIGKIFISSSLGPVALAYYAIGSYLLPIVRAMRSGITDAIYPELVRAHEQSGAAIKLWQRVNVLNCVMFFPAFVLLIYYADEIISLLFTNAYLPAVPVFNVLAFFLLRRCFNTDVLLRTTGRTGFMLWGTVGSLVLNVVLIVILSRTFGIVGPAIAFLVAEIVLELYYAHRARHALDLTIANLADWKSIFRIGAVCALAFPIVIGFDFLSLPPLIRILAASLVYFSAVLLVAYRLGVADIGRVAIFVWSRFHRRAAD